MHDALLRVPTPLCSLEYLTFPHITSTAACEPRFRCGVCLVPCRDKVVTWLCRPGDIRVLLAWARAMFTLTRTASQQQPFASRTTPTLAKEAGNRAAAIAKQLSRQDSNSLLDFSASAVRIHRYHIAIREHTLHHHTPLFFLDARRRMARLNEPPAAPAVSATVLAAAAAGVGGVESVDARKYPSKPTHHSPK